MFDALTELGLDLEDLRWEDLSTCNGMELNIFFDDYESDDAIAKIADEACLSCPVMVQCLQSAVDEGRWGCWGAIYLTAGKPDKNRNAHKTPEVWEEIRSRLGDQSIF